MLNYARFNYIKTGSIWLPLTTVSEVPERYDLTRYGKQFRGDAPFVRVLEGRVHGRICYRHCRIVVTVLTNSAWQADPRSNTIGGDSLKMAYLSFTTGLGTQHFEIHQYALMAHLTALMALPDDVLHAFLLAIVEAQMDGAGRGYQEASEQYKQAFVDGRLKKRKVRGANILKVVIEDAQPESPYSATA